MNMARSLHPGTLVAWVCLLMGGSALPAAAQNYAVSQERCLQLQNDVTFSLFRVQQGLVGYPDVQAINCLELWAV